MHETIWLMKGLTINVSIMQNLNWWSITLYDEMHISKVCFVLCQCYNFYYNNIWPLDEQRYILYFWLFDLKKKFALMLDLKFKDISILNNYMEIGKITIAAIKYDFKILIPLLCSIYQKVHPFLKHT